MTVTRPASDPPPARVVRLGDITCNPTEPGERWGRVIGIRKDIPVGPRSVIVREFREDDGEFPTGKLFTTAFLCAWEGP